MGNIILFVWKMRIKIKLFIALCLVAMVIGKESKTKKLQIGIKKRVENCTSNQRGAISCICTTRVLWRTELNLTAVSHEVNPSLSPWVRDKSFVDGTKV